MAYSIADLLMEVRFPKGATRIGYGISAQLDGRSTEMRIAKALAVKSNPGCKIEYSETQWERGEKEGTWHHMFHVDEPNGKHYVYAIEAIKIDPRFLVACAFYEFNSKRCSVVATYDFGTGHLYHVYQEDAQCQTATN